ncbi:MAG: hypothetical protein RL291_139 [Pseudomonadota bacterium]
MYTLFHAFLVCHIVTGTVALISFWVPVVGLKGAQAHRKWGRVFVMSLLATGASGLGMSICSIVAPFETHPHIKDYHVIVGLLGWMMVYLATLTITLAWNGYVTARNRLQHIKNRTFLNIGLNIATLVTATITVAYGIAIREPLMMGISLIGFAAGITNLIFIFKDQPSRTAYVEQHLKTSVGAGSAVYTAFISVGLVRWVPHEAFNPLIWGMPVVVGVAMMLFHIRRIQSGWQWQEQLKSPAHSSNSPDPQRRNTSSGMDVAATKR